MIDDKYTEGVWYDRETAEFVTIDRDDDGAAVLTSALDGNHLYSYGPEGAEFDGGEFVRVPEDAVENPEEWVKDVLDAALYSDTGIDRWNFTSEIGARYALTQVNIVNRNP